MNRRTKQLSLVKFVLHRFGGVVPPDNQLHNAVEDWERDENPNREPLPSLNNYVGSPPFPRRLELAILLLCGALIFAFVLASPSRHYDPADLNHDGVVDIKDLSIYLEDYRQATN